MKSPFFLSFLALDTLRVLVLRLSTFSLYLIPGRVIWFSAFLITIPAIIP